MDIFINISKEIHFLIGCHVFFGLDGSKKNYKKHILINLGTQNEPHLPKICVYIFSYDFYYNARVYEEKTGNFCEIFGRFQPFLAFSRYQRPTSCQHIDTTTHPFDISIHVDILTFYVLLDMQNQHGGGRDGKKREEMKGKQEST